MSLMTLHMHTFCWLLKGQIINLYQVNEFNDTLHAHLVLDLKGSINIAGVKKKRKNVELKVYLHDRKCYCERLCTFAFYFQFLQFLQPQ